MPVAVRAGAGPHARSRMPAYRVKVTAYQVTAVIEEPVSIGGSVPRTIQLPDLIVQAGGGGGGGGGGDDPGGCGNLRRCPIYTY